MRVLCIGLVFAQLLFDPTVNPEKLREGRTAPPPVTVDPSEFKRSIRDPQLCDSVKQHAGFIPFVGHEQSAKKFFFWLFESRNAPTNKETPLILWLSGGPGCSSSLALFAENGPCKVSRNGSSTVSNPSSWNERAHLLYVDQPAGTGWSEGTKVTGEEGVGNDMYAFLQAFYLALPQYKTNPLYITGESYSGHYIPAIAHRIFEAEDGFRIPLVGLAIGNGMTDPQVQYKYYVPMATDGGKSEGGTTEVNVGPTVIKVMEGALPACIKAINACNAGAFYGACNVAFVVCNYGEMVPYQLSGLNPYDVREKCKSPPLCYDFSAIGEYLNLPSVQEKLGVSKTWTECNYAVNIWFQNDFMRSYDEFLPKLLENGIRILIYAGDADFICNWLGNKHWTLELPWSGHEGFKAAQDAPYMLNGTQVGRKRSFKGFSFMQVYGAGHMVPMDKPDVALQMINDFVNGEQVAESIIM